jgi:DNA-binding CsgD family transcriptional regulator
LKEVNQKLSEAGKKSLYPIIFQLENKVEDDIWKEFEVHFQEVHKGFYNTLSQKHSDLTPNDLRLCAYLKLNLSTKEIASLTYQSAESIKTARYRLRKKLNLDRDTNLTAYLNSI